MPVDMSGSLGSMPPGTTEAGAVPAGERHNKTPVFVTGVTDTRGFLAWLRTSCPSSLSAQMKGEKLMIAPGTADGFRATLSSLRSHDGSKGVTFHTFSHPEDRCVRLLVKNLGRQMPESVVREVLEALGIRVQGVMQLRSGLRDQDAARDRSLTPQFVVSVARGPEVQKLRSLSELYGLRVSIETYVAPKAPLQCKRCQRFGHTQRNCGYKPRCGACGEPHPSGDCSTPKQQLKCCTCGGNHTANYRGYAKWKEAKAALTKRTPAPRVHMNGATDCSASVQATRSEPSAEQKSLGPEWSHLVRGGRVVKPTTSSQPQPTLKPAAAPKQDKAPASRKEVKATQPAVSAPQQARTKKQAMNCKSSPRPKKPNSAPIPPPNQSPIKEISDLFDSLPVNVCVELTRRLLTAVPTLPLGAARSRAVLKIVILFVAEYGKTP
jgi:hypothetical protein